MHAVALCDFNRTASSSLRDLYRTFSRAGQSWVGALEYTTAKLLSDFGYATALYGKWHLGDTQGRLPNDQGFDEWWGCMNSWDEAGYTAWSLFKETGVPRCP